MISSLAGVIMLLKVSMKLGGVIGQCLKLVVAGIVLSVFIHAGFELAAAYQLMSEGVLLLIMGILLSLGSVIFTFAGYSTLKKLD